ncbi:VaFE repeat-containing surface-anchored protein [Lapidilactobacillus luobeiensis]|uniref:VaFE repeat-containing surface-anchored protein n=1 Tax=Lapidilactobacillus luobeiensis TaxID=2950371 RepID=UPI0021C3E6A6|nr:VaFE repeat-containing surface-anchored protein [Lapidilactobacillus luobeiensis]
MKKRLLVLIGLLPLLTLFVFSGRTASAATDFGTKKFGPVTAVNWENKVWDDGIPFGEDNATIINNNQGYIFGIASTPSGQEAIGQKFRSTDPGAALIMGNLAYCLNYIAPTPEGEADPDPLVLTDTQRQALEIVLLLGYREIGTTPIKGPAVASLGNLDAYVVTQWLVQDIVQPEDKKDFVFHSDRIAKAVADFRAMLQRGIQLSLVADGAVTAVGTRYQRTYHLAEAHDYHLAGTATITLSEDIPDARIEYSGQSYPVSAAQGVDLPLGASFTISIPDHLPAGTLTIKAQGGFDSHDFTRYAPPVTGQQPSLVLGEAVTGQHLSTTNNLTWPTKLRPRIQTLATNLAGGEVVQPTIAATIIDRISYQDLEVGVTYTIKGSLIDRKTGQPILIAGRPVQAVKDFVPETAAGTVSLHFDFDASQIPERQIVIYEELYREDQLIAAHRERFDDDQTVTIAKLAQPILPETGGGDQTDSDTGQPGVSLTESNNQTVTPNDSRPTPRYLSAAATARQKLPQANERSTSLLTVIGSALLALVAIGAGIVWYRRRLAR